jgi:hypothetical protein
MDKGIETDGAVGAAVSEGEQGSSAWSTADDDRSAPPQAPVQRRRPMQKRQVVLRLMQGAPVEALSRRVGWPVDKREAWRGCGRAGIDAGLCEGGDGARNGEPALGIEH